MRSSFFWCRLASKPASRLSLPVISVPTFLRILVVLTIFRRRRFHKLENCAMVKRLFSLLALFLAPGSGKPEVP